MKWSLLVDLSTFYHPTVPMCSLALFAPKVAMPVICGTRRWPRTKWSTVMTRRNKKPNAEPKRAGVAVGRMMQTQLQPLWVPSVLHVVRSDVVLDARRPWHILPCHSKAGLFLRVRGTPKVTCLLLPCHISIHDLPSNGCFHGPPTHHLVSQLHSCRPTHPTSPACHTTRMTQMHQAQAIHVPSSSGTFLTIHWLITPTVKLNTRLRDRVVKMGR